MKRTNMFVRTCAPVLSLLTKCWGCPHFTVTENVIIISDKFGFIFQRKLNVMEIWIFLQFAWFLEEKFDF